MGFDTSLGTHSLGGAFELLIVPFTQYPVYNSVTGMVFYFVH